MKQEIKQAMIAGGWEFLALCGFLVCVILASMFGMIVSVVFFRALCVFVGVYAGCLLLVWAVRKLLKGEARMGIFMSGGVMAVSAVVLSLFISLWGFLAIIMAPIWVSCLLVWLACFLSRKESRGQTLKSAWQLGCMILMWSYSIGCLVEGIGVLVETVRMPGAEPLVVSSPFDWQAENEGKMVRVQGFLETDDELEISEWGIRHKALYIRVMPLGSPEEKLRFFREVSAKHFRLGQYRLAGIRDFRDFMIKDGVEIAWPAPFPLPNDAVTSLPPGLKEKHRHEGVNTLSLLAETDDADVSMEFCCYPCTPQCNVVVQGRQRGDTLEDVKVLRTYQRDTQMFDADSLLERNRVPAVAGCFLIALIFYLLGGAKGHSILMFGRPALCWIFPTLSLLCAVLQIICKPSCDLGETWICLLLTVPLLFISARVHRARARAAEESAGA